MEPPKEKKETEKDIRTRLDERNACAPPTACHTHNLCVVHIRSYTVGVGVAIGEIKQRVGSLSVFL